MEMQRIDLWTQWGKKTVGQMEKVALTCTLLCVKYTTGEELLHNTGSPL